MDQAQEDLARWCKKKEIEAMKEANKRLPDPGARMRMFNYWAGQAEAFSNVWERLVFEGKEPSPQAYNMANEEWSAYAEKVKG